VSRRVERPATVVLVPDPVYGLRPSEVRWRDYIGLPQYAAMSAVLGDYLVAKPWWEAAVPRRGYRYWRMLVPPAGEILLYEDLDEAPGSEKRWHVAHIED
jgi:hypothetical protein